jgi:hypothetical protein
MIYKSLDRLNPEFRRKVELWLDENPEIFITESWRSRTRQMKLYSQGRTRDGKIVTWTLKSMHQLGLAVDIAFKGELYPKEFNKWNKVANSARGFGIDWGYNMWDTDKPHFQNGSKQLNMNIFAETISLLKDLWSKQSDEDKKKIGKLANKIRSAQESLGLPVSK